MGWGWGWGGPGRRDLPPHTFPRGRGAGRADSARGGVMNPAGCERTPGLRLFDTCLSLLTIHFLRVIYERNALIRLGFICPLLTIDAAAKMPRPSCLKVCPPPHFPNAVSFSLAIPHPLPLRPPPLPPAPFALLVAAPPGVLNQQKSSGQGQLGAKAGRFGARHPLGATSVGVLARLPARDQENLLPKCGGPLSKGEGEALVVNSPGAWLC